MSEIKFKIYGLVDIDNRRYDILDLWDPNKYPESFWYGESLVSLGYTLEDYNREEFHICQYTGLKDKNGKEIYEGDIVKCIEYFPPDTGVVEFKYYECGDEYYPSTYGWHVQNVLLTPELDIEVIGNIYENQELLEK